MSSRKDSKISQISALVNEPKTAFDCFREFPSLMSLSVRETIDKKGKKTGGMTLMVGASGAGKIGARVATFLSSYPTLAEFKKDLKTATIVEARESPGVRQSRDRERPSAGGDLVQHRTGSMGTLGCAIRVNGKDGYFVSSGHVIAGESGRRGVRDAIYQPTGFTSDGAGPDRNRLGELVRWVPERCDESNEADAAIGLVDQPRASMLARGVRDLGPVSRVGAPRCEQPIRFHGATSGVGRGTILDPEAVVRMESCHVYTRQIRYAATTLDGDSGAALLSEDGSELLGIHFGFIGGFAIANRADRAMALLAEERRAVATLTGPKNFERVTVDLDVALPISGGLRTASLGRRQPTDSSESSVVVSTVEEVDMGSPVVNVYVCCGDKHGEHGARPEAGRTGRQALTRFDRFRFYNGLKDEGSRVTLRHLRYTRKKRSTMPASIQVQVAPMLADIAGVNAPNPLGIPESESEKPDTIEVRFSQNNAGVTRLATLALTPDQIDQGFYLRSVTFEFRSDLNLYVDYVFGQDVNGMAGPDQIVTGVALPLSDE